MPIVRSLMASVNLLVSQILVGGGLFSRPKIAQDKQSSGFFDNS